MYMKKKITILIVLLLLIITSAKVLYTKPQKVLLVRKANGV